MKGKIGLVLLVAAAAAALYLFAGVVASGAGEDPDFLALYRAANAARSGTGIYARPAPGAPASPQRAGADEPQAQMPPPVEEQPAPAPEAAREEDEQPPAPEAAPEQAPEAEAPAAQGQQEAQAPAAETGASTAQDPPAAEGAPAAETEASVAENAEAAEEEREPQAPAAEEEPEAEAPAPRRGRPREGAQTLRDIHGATGPPGEERGEPTAPAPEREAPAGEEAPEEAGPAAARQAAPAPAPRRRPAEWMSRAGEFKEPPYVALMLAPLCAAETPAAAATAWFWTNVALIVAALFLSVVVLSGGIRGGGPAVFLVPFFAALPLVFLFLKSATVIMPALVLVLVGLALFRRGSDIAAGIVSALGAFSGLGVAVGAYYFLKREWRAAISFLVTVIVLLGVVPLVRFGPRSGLDEIEGYWGAVVKPYFSQPERWREVQSSDNQSVWAVLTRHTAGLSELTEQAAEAASEFRLNLTRLTDSWLLVLLGAVGGLLLLVSVIAVSRKLPERRHAVTGLEGALIVLAALILMPVSRPPALVALLFPLCAVVYVIETTRLRSVVHHFNYVGLVAASAFFYLLLDPRFAALGSGLLGAFILWIALLAALGHFRPQLVHGRVTATFGPERAARKVEERPIDLVRRRPEKVRREEGRERGGERGEGLAPMPAFTRRRSTFRPGEPAEPPAAEAAEVEAPGEQEAPQEEEPPEREAPEGEGPGRPEEAEAAERRPWEEPEGGPGPSEEAAEPEAPEKEAGEEPEESGEAKPQGGGGDRERVDEKEEPGEEEDEERKP